MSRIVIVGGGVIGLSLAYELACRNESKRNPCEIVLLDRGKFGARASRAGAGILLPANRATAIHPFEHLEASGVRLHETWASQLKEETGIDNGFRKCGGLYIARTAGEIALLSGTLEHWRHREIEFELLDRENVNDQFTSLLPLLESSPKFRAAFVPSEYQFRNPEHLRALAVACRQRGVSLHEEVGNLAVQAGQGRVTSIKTQSQTFQANQFVFAAGPWTQPLLEPLGVDLPMQPVRGHILLYKLPQRPFVPVINEGSRYLVPRDDGHVLAGSTIEESDFDDSIDEAEIAGLQSWASSVLPSLDESCLVDRWAGLRPGTFDGFPYMGALIGFANAYVSTGHFKSGLQLSTASAVAMADCLEGIESGIDLTPFAVSRVSDAFYRKSTENK